MTTKKWEDPAWLGSHAVIYETTSLGESSAVAFHLCESGIPRQLFRLTGGIEVAEEFVPGLEILYQALVDHQEQEDRDGIEGHVFFGGTRTRYLFRPEIVLPGITEVAAWLRRRNDRVRLYGIAPRLDRQQQTPFGLLLSVKRVPERPEESTFTCLHPQPDLNLVLQHSSDTQANYDDEWQRVLGIVSEVFRRGGWKALLIAYNGGVITKREIQAWLAMDERDQVFGIEPRYHILLVKGSGRITGEFAENPEITGRRNVWVAEQQVESIRGVLRHLGMLAQVRV